MPAFADVAPWVDIGQSRLPLAGPGVTWQQWSMFATSTLLWVAVPAMVGALRVQRADLA